MREREGGREGGREREREGGRGEGGLHYSLSRFIYTLLPVYYYITDKVREASDSALHKLRDGSKRKSVKHEMDGPKKAKKLKMCSWKHTFCCLALKAQVPQLTQCCLKLALA